MDKEEFYEIQQPSDTDVEPEALSMHKNNEGNFVIALQKQAISVSKGGHYENLAEKLPPYVLSTIAQEVLGGIQNDKESRAVWSQIIDEGMEQLGLRTDERTWPFEGAAGTYSSSLCQAWLATSATLISELLPPNGPAKADLLGDPSEEQMDRAERVENWYNLFFTRINKSFYPEIEQAIMWAVNNGSVFIKNYIDPITNMPVSLFVRPDDFIVNTSSTSISMASRITHQITINQKEMMQRQETGLYRPIKLSPDTETDTEVTPIQQRIEQIDGMQPPSIQYNKKHVVYECHIDLDLEKYKLKTPGDELVSIPKPYIVSIDRESRQILSIYRNWEEGDETFKRIECFVPFTYIPGFGLYGLGLFHIAAGNAKAATMIKRQLIDAGTLSNFPGGVRVKGMRFESNNVRVGPTEFIEIDTGGLPIQQSIMPMPYKEPSGILKDLCADLDKSVLDLAGAANTQLAEIQSNMPVGTILSIIEVSHKIQSAVVQRMHRSMGEVFSILFNLFAKVLPEEPYPFHIAGKSQHIMRSDFQKDITVIPASDPNLSTFPQRAMTVEALLNTAKEFPEYHNMYDVLKRFYKILKVPNIDEFLMDPNEEQAPPPLDPITENQYILTGKPVKAYIFQDQDAYIASKAPFLDDASLDPQVLQAFKANISERVAFKYQLMMQQMIGQQLPEDPSQLNPEQQNQIAMAVAEASQNLMQQKQQQTPPSVQEIAMAEVQVKKEQASIQAEIEMAKLEVERMKLQMQQQANEQKQIMDQMKLEVERMKIELERDNKELQAKTEAFKAQLKYHAEEDKIKSQESVEDFQQVL